MRAASICSPDPEPPEARATLQSERQSWLWNQKPASGSHVGQSQRRALEQVTLPDPVSLGFLACTYLPHRVAGRVKRGRRAGELLREETALPPASLSSRKPHLQPKPSGPGLVFLSS